MVQTDTGRFLNELGRLFEKAKAKDSVRITLKRSKSSRQANDALKDLLELQGLPYLSIYKPLHAGNLKPRKSKKPNEVQRLLALPNDVLYAHYAVEVSGAS